MGWQEVERKDARIDDDKSLLSPPVVAKPLYGCATAVVVIGAVAGAKVEVEVNSSPAGSAQVDVVLPYGVTIPVPRLAPNDKVRARQVTATAQSGWSAPEVVVRDHTADYPAGPPRPEIFPTPLYRCGVRTGVGNLLVGGNVWVTANGVEVGRVNGCGNPQGVNVTPPFGLGDKVRAEFELCGDRSSPSIEHTTTTPPAPLPAPVVEPHYAGGNQLEISNIANGAKVTVKRGGTTLGTWGCWGGSIRLSGFAPNFATGDVVEVFQSMCPGDPPSVTVVVDIRPCSSLPAPGAGPVQGGDTSVTFTSYAPGAVLSVWVNGQQAGRGGGPVVPLNRTVAYGDVVVVAQDLPGCTGQRVLRVNVPCVDPPVAGDPSGVDIYPVGMADLAQGKAMGRVYYPAEDDGIGVPFHARLAALGRVPLVVLAHGNHDPGVPNYLGYEYFQTALARMGFASISVDCNSQNGMGYSIPIIQRRADLIIGAIAALQQSDADPNWVLAGKVDFTRVGLFGHSQGGEAVVLVPQVIGLPNVSVRAVLALAPTEGGATNRTPDGYAFMTILPAADGDVWPNDGAIYYDRAVPAPFKSQLFVHFTNHQFYNRQWLDDDSLWPRAAPTAAVIQRYEHERIVLAYGSALYRAALLGHTTTPYLAGAALPAGVSTQHVHLSFQRAEALTVDNHEDGNTIATNSLGAATQQLGGLSADEFPFGQVPPVFNQSFYGSSVGMVARAGGTGRIFEQNFAGKRNLTGQEVWVRVAEVYDFKPKNVPPTGFQLGLRDANGTEFWVDSDDVGGVPRPYPRNPQTMKTMLKTVRFKASCFSREPKLDLSAIVAVIIRFNRADERAMALDDLQIVPG